MCDYCTSKEEYESFTGKFKVGQKVKYIGSRSGVLKKGEIYEIAGAVKPDYYLWENEKHENSYFACELHLEAVGPGKSYPPIKGKKKAVSEIVIKTNGKVIYMNKGMQAHEMKFDLWFRPDGTVGNIALNEKERFE